MLISDRLWNIEKEISVNQNVGILVHPINQDCFYEWMIIAPEASRLHVWDCWEGGMNYMSTCAMV